MKRTIAKILLILVLIGGASYFYFLEYPKKIPEEKIDFEPPEEKFIEKPEEIKEEPRAEEPKAEEPVLQVSCAAYNKNGYFLIKNFLLEREYSKELSEVKASGSPEYLSSLITDLEEFNEKYLKEKISDKEKIFPDHSFLSKFITISKDNGTLTEKEKLKEKILENIKLLEDFIFPNGSKQ